MPLVDVVEDEESVSVKFVDDESEDAASAIAAISPRVHMRCAAMTISTPSVTTIPGTIAFASAATPGSVFPSRNSSDAPPPVDT